MPDAMSDCVVVLVTLPGNGLDDADDLAEALVESGVAACVNILPPMRSTYRWEGEIETETERQAVVKTTRAAVPALWSRVRDLHPYEVPEFLVLPIVDGNEAYLKWIRESVTAGSGAPPAGESG